MQVRTVNNIGQPLYIKAQKAKSVQQSFPNKNSVVPYSNENLRANFLILSFKGKTPIEEFKEYAKTTNLDSFIEDKSFYKNPDFDAKGWLEFFRATEHLYDENNEIFFLNAFVNMDNFNQKLNGDFSPQKALELVKEFNTNAKLNNNISLEDILLFIDYYAQSDYSLDEFVDEVTYFKNLKDKNGESIFEPNLELYTKADLIIYMMEINRGSVKASDFQMLLDLILDGEVNSGILKFLPQNSDLPPNITADIDKLYQAYSDDKKTIDVFIPVLKSDEEAKSKLSVGDVYQIENEQNASIIGRNGYPTKLNMSREMCYDLFPPVQRFTTTQNLIGNCWEISILKALYTDPETRADLLKLFTQDGNDVIVKYPKATYGEVKFKNAQMPQDLDMNYYSNGAKGFQMLEYADGKEIYAANLFKFLYQTRLTESTPEEKALADRIEKNVKSVVDENKIILEEEQGIARLKISTFDKNKHGFNDPTTKSRHYGNSLNLFRRLGYIARAYGIFQNRKVQKDMRNPQFYEDCIVTVVTKCLNLNNNLSLDEQVISYDDGIIINHVYELKPATVDKKGNVTEFYLLNPYGGTQIKLSAKELIENSEYITYAYKDKNAY